ncbi:MAG: SMP-30/gluconolactonase/LRE family protein [Planctomycetes bacterium]|nr:SMP-30/gluconolactonase/LRE family protein [Planctomycetota bacterium]MCH9725474.1 SMP-30/gluconolactonase/LRE family protein [Planctomycetota bacterium]MCH9776571.1 SMP-30/gluconolactonase/LRE family protein [Planctomycetota bacterium]MCH9792495.1 SMP-30/gluconolactonase/LRE family protein [Planctomycetota bacterium]
MISKWMFLAMASLCFCFQVGLGQDPANSRPETHPLPETVAKNAKLQQEYAAKAFFEGPVWDPAGKKLYFTSFVGKDTKILRLDGEGKARVWLDKTKGINGTYLSLKGRMLGAQAFGQHLMSYGFGENGPTDTIIVAQNPKWNQPNDVCQTPNGNIYFTDPDFKNRKTSAVYFKATNGAVKKIITDMPLPNGVIASNDGNTLYVGDSHEKLWRSFPIKADGTVGTGKLFFDPKTKRQDSPDGMSIDAKGNLYLSGRGGVWVATPDGKSLGLIPIPEFCSNVTFGGPDGKTLYFTCSNKVYSLRMNVKGAQFP